jgi:dihydrofolate reductase
MRISIIVAVAENGVIGRDGKLPWRLPADLARFKRLTMGHTVIMGRRTWESIGRPLPGRRMVVVSRQPDYRTDVGDVEIVGSLDQALSRGELAGDNEAFVIGGAELFREALPRADRLYRTHVRAAVAGDTYFPEVNWSEWRLVESSDHDSDVKNEYPFVFEAYERSVIHGKASETALRLGRPGR